MQYTCNWGSMQIPHILYVFFFNFMKVFVKKDIKFGFLDGEAYLGNVPGLSDFIIFMFCIW